MRRVLLAGLSLAVVVGILAATVALATEQWPVAAAHDARPAIAYPAPHSVRIVLQIDAAAAACAAAIAAILSVAAAGPRRSSTLR